MPNTNPKLERDLVTVVQLASAVSLGTLAAVLYSVKAVTPRIQVQVSSASVVAFLLAALGSWAFWHATFELGKAKPVSVAARDPTEGVSGLDCWL